MLTLIVCFAFFMSGLAAIGIKGKLNETINKYKVEVTNEVPKTTVDDLMYFSDEDNHDY